MAKSSPSVNAALQQVTRSREAPPPPSPLYQGLVRRAAVYTSKLPAHTSSISARLQSNVRKCRLCFGRHPCHRSDWWPRSHAQHSQLVMHLNQPPSLFRSSSSPSPYNAVVLHHSTVSNMVACAIPGLVLIRFLSQCQHLAPQPPSREKEAGSPREPRSAHTEFARFS
jgi:hypothetical protein